MKITNVEPIALAIPFQPMDPPSIWAGDASKQLLVRVDTDEGITGWGEAFSVFSSRAVGAVISDLIKHLVIGSSPLEIPALLERVQRVTMLLGRGGIAMAALSGVELALWDIAGKVEGVPVHQLIGDKRSAPVAGYASLLRYGTAKQAADAAAQWADKGFRGVKLHQADTESVRETRAAVGSKLPLMLDSNCPWTVDEAIAVARELGPYGLEWFEEPVWPPEDYEGLARLRAAVDIPIAAGENEGSLDALRRMAASGAVDVLQPGITRMGGIQPLLSAAALATELGLALAPHSMHVGPGLAAMLHVAAVTPSIEWIEIFGAELETSILEEPITHDGGLYEAPSGPGLGVTVDEEAVRRFAA